MNRMHHEPNRSAKRLWESLVSIVRPRRSLSGKLIIVMLATTVIALAAAGAALLLTDLHDSRAAWADDVSTEAAILSLAVQPALSFNDHDYARRNLEALQARASIRVAALYRPDGMLFEKFVREGES